MVIVITGPTATGKTKLSVELAKKINGEIINCDSTQIFKTLDIATAKVTNEEMDGIVHYLIDIKDITDNYTVYDYQRDAREKINEILKKNKTPILVGGTGLYIKAALYDYKFEEESKNENFENVDTKVLYDKLMKVDPESDIHPNNRKRIIRALNYYLSNGKKLSSKEKSDKILYDTIFIGLSADRSVLYDKINKRVDKMIENGLLEEAYKVYKSNIRTKAVMTPIGYKELFLYFENKMSLDECIEKIKQKSRNYAKRQYTWFNHQMNIKWFNVNYDNFDKTIDEVYKYIENETNFQ